MSWVMVSPELVVAAAADLAGIGSAISSANAAAAVNTTGLLTAGADEVSTAIAALFGAQGQAYQAASAQAAAFYAQFVQALSAGGGAYAAAEAAAVSPLLAPINAQFVAATGRPLIRGGHRAPADRRRPRQRNRPPTPQNHRDPPSRTDHLPQPRHRHGSPRLDRQRRLLTCSGVHRHGSCNSLTRVTNTPPPTTGQWTPTHPPAPPRSRNWPLAAVASVAIAAVVLGAAALIVALTRPTNSGPATAAGTTAEPTYTAAETAAAHQKLCEVYKLAAQAVRIDTHGGDRALAGVATVNGALMLEQAVNTAPALTPADRIAALTLAHAYSRASAMASVFHRDDPEWRSTVDDVNVKDARMKAVCGGG